jgi:hypothetical protein
MKINHTVSVSAFVLTLLFCADVLAQSFDRQRGFVFSGYAIGDQEVPPSGSQAFAEVFVVFEQSLGEAQVLLKLHGVNSPVFGAHFHCARPGQNGPVAFGLLNPGPLYAISGEASVTITNAEAVGDCTGVIGRPVSNIAALYFAMKDGLIYLNVHTTNHPPGEVRAQMIQVN